MTKIERVRAARAGTPVDHPPFTVWYHFGLQHAPAPRTAHLYRRAADLVYRLSPGRSVDESVADLVALLDDHGVAP